MCFYSCSDESTLAQYEDIDLEKNRIITFDTSGINYHDYQYIKNLIKAFDEPIFLENEYDSVFNYISCKTYDSTYCISLRFKNRDGVVYTKVFHPSENRVFPDFYNLEQSKRMGSFPWRYKTSITLAHKDNAKKFSTVIESISVERHECLDCPESLFISSKNNRIRIRRFQTDSRIEDSLCNWVVNYTLHNTQ